MIYRERKLDEGYIYRYAQINNAWKEVEMLKRFNIAYLFCTYPNHMEIIMREINIRKNNNLRFDNA
jgi:hypothetical protein